MATGAYGAKRPGSFFVAFRDKQVREHLKHWVRSGHIEATAVSRPKPYPAPEQVRSLDDPWRARAALDLLAFVLIVSLFVPVVGGQEDVGATGSRPGQVMATATHPFADPAPRTTSERVPLLEVFTATWCPPCAPADRALERLLDEMSPGLSKGAAGNDTNATDDDRIDLSVLAFHPFPDPEGEDPYGIPEGHARMRTKYDAFWFPTVWIDGHLEDGPTTRSVEVAAGMEEVHYQSYKGLIGQALEVPPVFEVTTEWTHDARNLTVHVHLEALALAEGPFLVRGALWEDHLRFAGANGIEDHRMTVRSLTSTQVVPALAPGESTTLTWKLRVPAHMEFDASGATFFVETPIARDDAVTPAMVMAFAAGVGGVAAVAVFALRTHERKERRDRHRARAPPVAPTAAEGRLDVEGRL